MSEVERIFCIFCGFEVLWPVAELYPVHCPVCFRAHAFTVAR